MIKKGVLLVNLGTPDAPTRGAVYRYLRQFLTDGRVIDVPWLPRQILVQGIIAPFRSGMSAKGYQKLWTKDGSPLKHFGVRLREMVAARLGDAYMVELAMRYQNPSIESAIERLMKAGVNEVTVLPLFPQYASASTGSVFEEVSRVFSKYQVVPSVRIIQSFPENEGMISVFADNARKMNYQDYDFYLFSYHGLPQRHMRKGDITQSHCLKVENCCDQVCAANVSCYSAQCRRTTQALVKELQIPEGKYKVSFQSRLGRDPWVQPYTQDVMKEMADAGIKKVLVFSPAFVSDCLETTIEISEEYHEEFLEMGGEVFDLVPSLNDNPMWADAVTAMVR